MDHPNSLFLSNSVYPTNCLKFYRGARPWLKSQNVSAESVQIQPTGVHGIAANQHHCLELLLMEALN
jgi:hypothetical protein